MNPHWNQWIVFGWLFFFVIFLGLDAAAWISGDRRIPTFSRVVTHLLPWWVVPPPLLRLVCAFSADLCRKG